MPKVSELTAAGELSSEDLLLVVQSGNSRKSTAEDVKTFLSSTFATANQGSLADTAVQPDDLNNLTGVGFDLVEPSTSILLGDTRWNINEETLETVLANNVVIQHGQEILYHVLNRTGSTITGGTLCMISGTDVTLNKLLIKPWDGSASSKYIIGIATSNILTEDDDPVQAGTGYVTHFGKVHNIQTNGANYTESWANGQTIYAGATSGLTKTLPAAPSSKTMIAIVINAHASNGTLFVRLVYGSQLGEDELVELSSLTNGDLITYNNVSKRFENKSPTTAGILVTGDVVDNLTSISTTTPLSAAQGNVLNTTKVSVSGPFSIMNQQFNGGF